MESKEILELAKHAKDGKLQIEIINRKGEAEEFLKPVEPLKENALELAGNSGTVLNFLSKRHHLFVPDKCHINVDKEGGIIVFKGNECQADDKHITTVYSSIEKTEKFENLDINNGVEFEPLDLARYLRKRKMMFIDQEQFMKVFTALSTFKAEVNRQIEKADDRSGNATNAIRQEVTHNMPRHFNLRVPVFKDAEPITVEVEVDVNPNSLACSLMSFDIDEKIEQLRDSIIENELSQEIYKDFVLKDFCVVFYS